MISKKISDLKDINFEISTALQFEPSQLPKKNFWHTVEVLLFEKNEMEQKLNFNHNALTIEQLLLSRSNCSIVRAIGQFVHTAHCI